LEYEQKEEMACLVWNMLLYGVISPVHQTCPKLLHTISMFTLLGMVQHDIVYFWYDNKKLTAVDKFLIC